MKESKILIFIAIYLISVIIGDEHLAAIILFCAYVLNFFYTMNNSLAFREFALLLYALNFLFSPAIAYNFNDENFILYRMKTEEIAYFEVAIPSIFALHLGMFLIPTTIFKTNFSAVKVSAFFSSNLLRLWVVIGSVLFFMTRVLTLPVEIAFFIYLISSIRFVGAYGLFALDAQQNKWYLYGLIGAELFFSIRQAMFHDSILWMVFFLIFYSYLKKPSIQVKLISLIFGVVFLFVLQNSKEDYRDKTWFGNEEANFGTLTSTAVSQIEGDENYFGKVRFMKTLTRVNQGWILSSTIDNMDRTQDFQEMNMMTKYIEGALLPRFLSPDKISAGDKVIFNKFSGHTIGNQTSMGLGIIADGYVGYGKWGSWIFCFVFGVSFGVVFKVVEIWSKVSIFYIFLIFPILNYAIRPDCEFQTVLGHMLKGLIVFTAFTRIYNNYFSKAQALLKHASRIKTVEVG